MALLLVVLLTLGAVTAADASFTLEEKARLVWLGTAGTWVDDGMLFLDQLAIEANNNNNIYLRNAWSELTQGNTFLAHGISLLLGGDPDFAKGGVLACHFHSSCADGGKPRTEWVSFALTDIATARQHFVNAKGYFTQAKNDATQSSAFNNNAAHAADVSMLTAINHIDVFTSAGLTYLNPATIYDPRTVGPHGVHQEGISDLYTAINSANEGLDQVGNAYCYVCNGDPAWTTAELDGFHHIIFRIANIIGKMRFQMFANSLIPFDSSGQFNTCGKSPFRLVADALENMISNHSESQSVTHCCAGIPYHYDNMGIGLADSGLEEGLVTRSFFARDQFRKGTKKLMLEAWRYSDGSVWKGAFEFPSLPTLTELRKQANFANDPFGPPLCPDSTPPTVAITNPTPSQTVGGTITATADASDNIAVSGVQFYLDNNTVCGEDKVAPYQCVINTALLTNASHTVKATAHDAANNTTTSAVITFTVNNVDTIAPVVSIPLASAAALLPAGAYFGGTGTVTLTASCTDNIGCVGVQWTLDGVNLGSETTVAPWSLSWDTTGASNATHAVRAVARDAAGNTTTSAALSVKVAN